MVFRLEIVFFTPLGGRPNRGGWPGVTLMARERHGNSVPEQVRRSRLMAGAPYTFWMSADEPTYGMRMLWPTVLSVLLKAFSGR
jgi:hypothetical protein